MRGFVGDLIARPATELTLTLYVKGDLESKILVVAHFAVHYKGNYIGHLLAVQPKNYRLLVLGLIHSLLAIVVESIQEEANVIEY